MITVVLIVMTAFVLVGLVMMVLRSGNNPRKNKSGTAEVRAQQQTARPATRGMGAGDD